MKPGLKITRIKDGKDFLIVEPGQTVDGRITVQRLKVGKDGVLRCTGRVLNALTRNFSEPRPAV